MESNQDSNTHRARVQNLIAAPFLHLFFFFPFSAYLLKTMSPSSTLTSPCYYNVFFSALCMSCESKAWSDSAVPFGPSILPRWWCLCPSGGAWFTWLLSAVLMSSEWSHLLISSWKRRRSHWHCLWERKTNYVSFDLIFLANSLFCLGKASCLFMFFLFQNKNWITGTVQVMRARLLFGKSMISLR